MQRSISITALTVLSAIKFASLADATSYVDACAPEPDEYEYIVERYFRDSWSTPLAPLIMRFALPGRTETAIALGRDAFGFTLIRLQFDRSLWYESWVEVEGGEKQDFARVPIRVAATSIPIPDQMAESLSAAYEVVEVADGDDRNDVIILDGVVYSIVQSDGTCLSLHSPPPESYAGRIMELFAFLESEALVWRQVQRREFESTVARRIRALPESE